jgi:hypothetical protein
MPQEPLSSMSPMSPTDNPLLEQRVRRLEDSVAQLQDLRQLEDRVTERLARRLAPTQPSNGILDTPPSSADPQRPLSAPPRIFTQSDTLHGEGSYSTGDRGLVLDMVADARCMVRMYVDPRYNLGWFARLVPLAFLLAILTSLIWIPGIHLMPEWVAHIVSKLVDLVLAYVLFKVLIREARRYRETAPDLPPSLRL